MVSFLQGLQKLSHPFCFVLGILAVAACIGLRPFAQTFGIMQSAGMKDLASSWVAVPKTSLGGQVLEQGIQYTGSCGYPIQHLRLQRLVGFNGTLGPCAVEGSGASCSRSSLEIFDAITGQLSKRRLGFSTALRVCKDAYIPWFKIDLPGKGPRCVFRFGVEELSEVKGADAVKGSPANANVAFAFRNHPVGTTMTAWGVQSPLAADHSACILGFSDIRLLHTFVARMTRTDETSHRLKRIVEIL